MQQISNHEPLQKKLSIAAIATILLFFWSVVASFYFLRASSDPHNWLYYAHHFREEVLQSRWPYGFPLFLRMLLPLTGPYYIFMVNLPLLMMAFVLIFQLASKPAKSHENKALSCYAGIAAALLALSADARDMMHYINPYRDPLSYVLVLASLWIFIRALNRRRTTGIFASGVLLGLACSVREPSILMVLPLAAYGLHEWWTDRQNVPFWRTTSCFAIGFVMALIPLLLQTWMATRQVLLPPQAAIQSSIVPGAHFRLEVFRSVSHGAWEFYRQQQPWLPLLALLGVITAWRDRHKEMLWLILPASLVYFIFYAFYWTFVPRYFYIVTLLWCILGGYGTGALLRFIHHQFSFRTAQYLAWGVLLVAGILSALHLLRAQPPRRALQVSDARAFAQQIEPLIPENAVVFAQRNMCELLQVVAMRRSYAWSFEPHLIIPHVKELKAAGTPIYAMRIPYGAYPYGDTIHLSRLYRLTPLVTMDPGDFNLVNYAPQPFTLLKIEPSTEKQVSTTIPIKETSFESVWLTVDPGYLSSLATNRNHATLLVNGHEVADMQHWQGANILVLNRETFRESGKELHIEVLSDQALPPDVRAKAGNWGDPIDLDFDLHAVLDHRWRWQGDILPPDLVFRKPRLQDKATLLIPTPEPQHGEIFMEWVFRSIAHRPGGKESIYLYEGDQLIADVSLPRDHHLHSFMIPLSQDGSRQTRQLRLRREHPQLGMFPELEVHRLVLHRPSNRMPVDVLIGFPEDAPFIKKGFYQREQTGPENAFRWTNGSAELSLPVLPDHGDMVLTVHYSLEHVLPPVRPSVELTVRLDGQHDVNADSITISGTEIVWKGRFQAEMLQADNRIILETPPWSPADHGAPDARVLGVMVRRILWEPAP